MAKKPDKKTIKLLNDIDNGTVKFLSAADGQPLATNDPPLIEANTAVQDPTDPSKVAVRLTPAGKALVPVAGAAAEVAPSFTIMTDVPIPASKRGNKTGSRNQYPFEDLQVNGTFFVPVSEKHPDPVKTLGSTVSAMNTKYSEGTGEFEEVERTKRGKKNKAVLDAAGNKIREMVKVEKKKAIRKFVIRPVTVGVKYGNWVAPANGALIGRTL